MPGRNGTGPMGEGAMSGRRMGRCANKDVKPTVEQSEATDQTAEAKQGPGMGRGLGKGKGRGFGRAAGGQGGGAGMRHRNGLGHNTNN